MTLYRFDIITTDPFYENKCGKLSKICNMAQTQPTNRVMKSAPWVEHKTMLMICKNVPKQCLLYQPDVNKCPRFEFNML